ncbi:MAG: type II secretion system protein [Patescibacteria group bacterium]
MLFFRKKINKKQFGFTVIELVVVSGIMVLLLTLTITNFRGFEKTQVLSTEADKLVSVIRQAQIWALTGQTSDNIRYSYGIHLEECNVLETCEYIFFKDIDEDYIYDQNEFVVSGKYNFIKGVYIDSVDPNSSGVLDVLFVPPLTDIYFNGESLTTEAEIVLKSSMSSDNSKTITINQESGQIKVE